MIEVEGLEKLYGDFPAVRGLSFRVQPGRGARAGRARTAPGRRRPSGASPASSFPAGAGSGSAGTTWPRAPVAAKSLLAFIPDEPHLFDYLTVEEHLRFVGPALPGGGRRTRGSPALLEELELATKRDALPGELSRGMKQKLAIACGLLHQPAGAAARRAAHRPRPGRHPADEGDDRPAGRGRRRGDPQLAPAPPGRGDLHPGPGHATRGRAVAFGTIAEIVASRPALSGRRLEDVFLALITPDGAAAGVIRVFAYLAWRSAYNRVAPPDPPAPEPAVSGRARASASPTSGSWRWSSGPQPAPAAVVGAALGRAARRARRGRRGALGLDLRRRAAGARRSRRPRSRSCSRDR